MKKRSVWMMDRAFFGAGIFLFLFSAQLSFFPAGLLTAQDAGIEAVMIDYTLPQYKNDKNESKLQFIVCGRRAVNKGALIFLTDSVIDLVRDDVRDLAAMTVVSPSTVPYALDAAVPSYRNFWKNKKHTQGLIFSEKAQFDKTTGILRSDDRVYFRSPYLDVDGLGIDADVKNKTIHIRSDVRVILRPEGRAQAERKRLKMEKEAANTDSSAKKKP